jgi:hypothetical protein
MPGRHRHKIAALFSGLLTGVLLAGVVGALLCRAKMIRNIPKRYDAKLLQSTNKEFNVFAASSLDRIFRDGKTLLKPSFTREVALSLARHEYESFQVIVSAQDRLLESVMLDASDLVDERTGKVLSRENVTWRVVGYVPTVKPYYPVKYVGRWPDPLTPPRATDIDAGIVQPFWVTVYAPEGTPPGLYKGAVSVSARGLQPRKIPLEVRVYDFTLPVEGSLKTAFDFYGHETFRQYPQKENESKEAYQARLDSLNHKYILAMLRYRINPILNVDPASDADLARVDRYRVDGLNNFSIGKRGGTLGNNWPAGDDEIERLYSEYRGYGEILTLNKLAPYTYIYTWDEGELGNPQVAKICAMVHRAHPALRNMVCYHGFWDPDKHPGWGKDIDIWTFQIDRFNEQKMRRLQELGIEIWMYISGPGGYGSPNLAMDFDSIDYRVVPWLCWKYDIKGFLYWCVNWWPKVNPFVSARNSKWEQNGNGLLFYPGEDGPIASLRLEIFRDGMEDYEYIQLLMRRLKELKKRGLAQTHQALFDQSVGLLTVDKSIAESMMGFTKDAEALKKRRDAIAERIEQFDKILAGVNTD